MAKFFGMLLLFFTVQAGFAQALIDPTEIEEKVHQEINEGFLKSKEVTSLKNKYPDAKGTLSLFVTVAGKGLVQTVFKSEGDIANVAFTNRLQDLLKAYRFDFALKKGLTHKVQHDFTF